MQTLKLVIKWFLGILFIFAGLMYLISGSFVGGICMFISGFLLTPATLKLIEAKLGEPLNRPIKYTIIIATYFIGSSALVQSEIAKQNKRTAEDMDKAETTTTENTSPINTNIATKEALPQYKSIRELIEAQNDYHEEDGTFKIISQNPLHIQLSKPALKGELEENLIDDNKRSTIYIGFRVFAQTNIDKITITSMPIQRHQDGHNSGYISKYQTKVVLTRDKARKILEKYYGHSDFTKMFGDYDYVDKNIYYSEVSSKDFKRMLFDDQGAPTLTKVFKELQ